MDNLVTINSGLKALNMVRCSLLEIFKFLANTPISTEIEINESVLKHTPYINDLNILSNNLENRIRYIDCQLIF